MEFESEDAARNFYSEYARRLGFVVRVMQRRRSGIDGRTLARRLGCNKQGFSPNIRTAAGPGPDKKPRPSAREGCKATILVKMDKSGKWVVTRFEKDHNHPLVVTASGFSSSGDKDKKIEELMKELEHQEHLCATYREKLVSFMNNVEEQTEELASKIQLIVDNVRKVESEVLRINAEIVVAQKKRSLFSTDLEAKKIMLYQLMWSNNVLLSVIYLLAAVHLRFTHTGTFFRGTSEAYANVLVPQLASVLPFKRSRVLEQVSFFLSVHRNKGHWPNSDIHQF
ncbi:PROTEIN FAR1-RELATED SEQUENCE 5-LIKE [Salix viminalis]|uniref:PROTEIN FAR1-RELATED SEQUENCE 5-LIKE n=1 Tax=Salix viminalis TaxID=40686 RepID=A0A9Q0UFC8_SALVM|nr:PROTEIN FAR1-RELATED SEQUENCE 5-LIKE [Salix viminalis]